MTYLKKNTILICLLVLLIVDCISLNSSLNDRFSICFKMTDYPEVGIAQLFFDKGEGVSEKSSLSGIVDNGIISFNIPFWKYNKIVNIRFDPINYKHDVIIERVFFCQGEKEVFEISGAELLNGAPACAGILRYEYSDEKATVICENNDPIIYFDYEIVTAYNHYYRRAQLAVLLKIAVLVCLTFLFSYIFYNYYGKEFLHVRNILNKWLYKSENKKYYVIVSFVVYLLTRIIVMVHYRGYYFTDEFYFLAESNPNYLSTYNRAPYMAALIRIFTKIGGDQYFAVKAVPFFCGIVSFVCVMYLSYILCRYSVSILLAGMLMSFHALFVFNDFYVRMYSFQEMELLILAVILYKTTHSTKRVCKVIWMLSGFALAYGIYYLTEDISGQIPLISYLCAAVYLAAGRRTVRLLKEKGYLKIAIGIICIMFIGIEVLVVLIKNQGLMVESVQLELVFFKKIYRLIAEFRIEDSAFLIKYLFIDSFILTFSFILSGIWLIKEKKEELLPIFLLAMIPLTGFAAMLYNCRIVRTFIGYFALMVIMVVLFWDYLFSKKKYALCIIGACVITILTSPVDLTWKQFTEQLYLYHEIFFCDYEQLMQDTRLYEENGKQVAALFGGEQVLAYFQYEPDINLCVWDNNQKFNYQNEELLEEIKKLESDDEEYILIMDKAGADKLNEIGKYYSLLDRYEFKIYNRNVEFNSLYLIVIE